VRATHVNLHFVPAAESLIQRRVAPHGSPRHRPLRPPTGRIYDGTTVTAMLRACGAMVDQWQSRHVHARNIFLNIPTQPSTLCGKQRTPHRAIAQPAPTALLVREFRSIRLTVYHLMVGAPVAYSRPTIIGRRSVDSDQLYFSFSAAGALMPRRTSSCGAVADFWSLQSRVIGATVNRASGGGLQPTARHWHGAHSGMQQQRTGSRQPP
jgi:hypothetical protein